MFEHPVRCLYLCLGYVVLLPVLLFLWDTEKFSTPGVWWSGAEKKKRGKKTSALFANQKQMFWGFWRSYCYVVSPCAWLWGGKMKTASRLASCWVQIKITVRRREQLLRETGWHRVMGLSLSHFMTQYFTKAGSALQPLTLGVYVFCVCECVRVCGQVLVMLWGLEWIYRDTLQVGVSQKGTKSQCSQCELLIWKGRTLFKVKLW